MVIGPRGRIKLFFLENQTLFPSVDLMTTCAWPSLEVTSFSLFLSSCLLLLALSSLSAGSLYTDSNFLCSRVCGCSPSGHLACKDPFPCLLSLAHLATNGFDSPFPMALTNAVSSGLSLQCTPQLQPLTSHTTLTTAFSSPVSSSSATYRVAQESPLPLVTITFF